MVLLREQPRAELVHPCAHLVGSPSLDSLELLENRFDSILVDETLGDPDHGVADECGERLPLVPRDHLE